MIYSLPIAYVRAFLNFIRIKDCAFLATSCDSVLCLLQLLSTNRLIQFQNNEKLSLGP